MQPSPSVRRSFVSMEGVVENSCEAVNYLVTTYWDRAFDTVNNKLGLFDNSAPRRSKYKIENTAPSATGGGERRRKQKNRLPSPEGSIESWDKERYRSEVQSFSQQPQQQQRRESSLDRESEFSDRVIRAYEQDPRDPTRRAEHVLPNRDLKRLQRDNNNMSYANGSLSAGQYQQRANSAQPPRSRYYDDDEEYGSDYDDRRGSRYQTTGRGYDDRDYDDRGDYREVVETERYRGPAGNFDPNRRQSYRSNDPYNQGGQLTQYNQQSRRSTTEVDDYNQVSRRSRSRGSRGRRNSERDRGSRSRSRSYSRSRSRSRSGSGERGIRGEVSKHFDTSLQGLGVGLAGAVVGGMAGRHFGERNPRHKNRDILLGAVVGGLGANAAETKWSHWQEDKREKLREDEDRWEQRYDPRDYGRSRSSMR